MKMELIGALEDLRSQEGHQYTLNLTRAASTFDMVWIHVNPYGNTFINDLNKSYALEPMVL